MIKQIWAMANTPTVTVWQYDGDFSSASHIFTGSMLRVPQNDDEPESALRSSQLHLQWQLLDRRECAVRRSLYI